MRSDGSAVQCRHRQRIPDACRVCTTPEASAPPRVTHEEAFLHDILRHPTDDAPRLIFADWLDDHGQPQRGEFIRTQVGLARLGPDDPWRAALQEREADLLAEHGERWRGPLLALGVRRAEFRRGLIEEVQLEEGPAGRMQ